jgi:hypothetical protein
MAEILDIVVHLQLFAFHLLESSLEKFGEVFYDGF